MMRRLLALQLLLSSTICLAQSDAGSNRIRKTQTDTIKSFDGTTAPGFPKGLKLIDNGTNYVLLSASSAVTSSYTLTWPIAQANGFVKNASGALSFSSVSLTADVSGILPPANGGTGQNSTAVFPTSGTVVTEAATETLTNKTLGSTNTLTGATAGSFTNTGTITLPTTTTTLIGRVTADQGANRLTLKDLDTTSVRLVNNADTTKRIMFDTGTTTSGTTTTLQTSASTDRTIVFPDASDTLVGKATTDTLTNKTLTSPAISGASVTGTNTFTGTSFTFNSDDGAGTVGFRLKDPNNGFTEKFDLSGLSGSNTLTLPNGTVTLVGSSTTQSLLNKTLGSTNTLTGATSTSFTGSGASTITLPTSTSTLATLALSETLTNKTMGSTNTLTGATATSFTGSGPSTITLPTSTSTLATLALAETLTNKTISGASNTLTVRLANDVTGTLPTGNGGTNKTTWTAGSIPYLSSTTAFNEDNANLFWDGTNHRLGIGTASPQKMLESSASAPVVQWRLTDTSIAHGITTGQATTTIAQVGDASSDGGIEIDAFAQSTTQAMIHKADNVTASTSIPVMEFRAGKKSGTTTGNGANSDMLYAFSKNDGTALVTMTGDGVTNFSAGLKIAGSSTLGTFTRGSKSTTFQSDGTSSVATAAVTVQYYRIDDWVTVFFPVLTFSGVTAATGYIGTGGPGNINNQTPIDSFARPATANQESLCVPWTLGTTKQTVVGRMVINTAGTFTLNRDNASTSFPNGDNTTGTNVTNTNAFSCTYYVGTGS